MFTYLCHDVLLPKFLLFDHTVQCTFLLFSQRIALFLQTALSGWSFVIELRYVYCEGNNFYTLLIRILNTEIMPILKCHIMKKLVLFVQSKCVLVHAVNVYGKWRHRSTHS